MHCSVRLIKRVSILPGTTEISLDASGTGFRFSAGQYLTLRLPDLDVPTEHARRHDFSIASSPTHPETLSVAFRESQSAYKRFILNCPIGATLEIEGPKGVMMLPDKVLQPLVFLAGGIGVTPFLSMAESLTETRSSQEVTLITINHNQITSPYRERLLALPTHNPHLQIVERLGRPDDAWISHQMTLHPNAIWYVAGPPAMVASMQNALELGHIDPRNIHRESFTGYL